MQHIRIYKCSRADVTIYILTFSNVLLLGTSCYIVMVDFIHVAVKILYSWTRVYVSYSVLYRKSNSVILIKMCFQKFFLYILLESLPFCGDISTLACTVYNLHTHIHTHIYIYIYMSQQNEMALKLSQLVKLMSQHQ